MHKEEKKHAKNSFEGKGGSKGKSFNYESIGPGYYHEAMVNGKGVQRFWLSTKMEFLAGKIPRKKISVLDVGCGPGSLFYMIRKQNKRPVLTGTDLVPAQIAYAKKIVPDARFFVADVTKRHNLPKADIITLVEVIEHLPESREQRLFRSIARILKPGGKFIITTPNYHSLWPIIEWFWNRLSPVSYEHQHINKKTIKTLTASLRKAGFKVKRTDTLFIISPFVSLLSPKLAKALIPLEQKLLPRAGASIMIEVSL